jgi:hypothetical protein
VGRNVAGSATLVTAGEVGTPSPACWDGASAPTCASGCPRGSSAPAAPAPIDPHMFTSLADDVGVVPLDCVFALFDRLCRSDESTRPSSARRWMCLRPRKMSVNKELFARARAADAKSFYASLYSVASVLVACAAMSRGSGRRCSKATRLGGEGLTHRFLTGELRHEHEALREQRRPSQLPSPPPLLVPARYLALPADRLCQSRCSRPSL